MDETTLLIIGIISTVLSLCSRIPQIYKMIITKSVKDLSWWMFAIHNLSNIGYFIYGAGQNDWIYAGSAGISITQNLIILILYYKWNHFES